MKAGGFVHVGGRDERGHPLDDLPFCQNGPEVPPRNRVDAGRGFVQNSQLRLMNQRADQPEFLFHAARELLHQPSAKTLQAGDRQQSRFAFTKVGLGHQPEPGEEVDVLLHGELGVEIESQSLGEKSDPPLHLFRRPLGIHDDPEHLGGSSLISQHSRDRLHHRAFPCTIRPDEAVDLPSVHGEVQAVDGEMVLVPLDEAGHPDDHIRRRWSEACHRGFDQATSSFQRISASAGSPGVSR